MTRGWLMSENTKCLPAVMQTVSFEVCWCFFLFPDKWCNIAMDGTSAINMLHQYPLWSLSQSAEITFVMFLFCWYRIWSFHSMCLLILLVYHTRCWPTCILYLFSVSVSQNVLYCKNSSSSKKVCEHEIWCLNTCWISDMAEEAEWITTVQNTFFETI